MLYVSLVFSEKKIKTRKKFRKKCSKFWILKLKKILQNQLFNFFPVLFLLNHLWDIFFHPKKIEWLYLLSFYFISRKPQKTPNLRENREYTAEFCFLYKMTLKFEISDEKWFRIVFQTCWVLGSTSFCCTVLSLWL